MLPFFLIITLLCYLFQGKPVFFKQQRPGKNGKIFVIWKFRTMKIGNEQDDLRMTRLGKILRKTSLDELPQLWNILNGDMSWIGPRPLLCEYLALYSDEQMKRHLVKPGITGWAQVNGRNVQNWQDRFQLDVYYVENLSILLDIKIILLSFLAVIKMEGDKPMEIFKGNQ